MNNNTVNHTEFYASYQSKVIALAGYPSRAAFKNNLIFKLFGKQLYKNIDTIKIFKGFESSFGFRARANTMSYFIAQKLVFRAIIAILEIEKVFEPQEGVGSMIKPI